MVSTTDPLAQRLVHTTAQAIYGAAYGKATERRAERAVVAVLRELADTPLSFVMRGDLTRLADSIEKGEK